MEKESLNMYSLMVNLVYYPPGRCEVATIASFTGIANVFRYLEAVDGICVGLSR